VALTALDSVRAYLQSHGGSYIEISDMTSFVRDSKIPDGRFKQAFYRLRTMGEIDTDVKVSDGGRRTIVGIKLVKMPSMSTIVKNDAETKKISHKSSVPTLKAKIELPFVVDYLKKKNVIAEITSKLADSGFIPDDVITFSPDPMGEEAIALLDVLGQAQAALSQLVGERDQLKIDLEATQEINRRYENSKKFTADGK